MVLMMIHGVTDTQQAALRYYAEGGKGERAPHPTTVRSLLGKGLLRERQATDAEKLAIGRPTDQPWRITEPTDAGRTVLGQIDSSPSVPANPFAGLPDDDADPFAPEAGRRF